MKKLLKLVCKRCGKEWIPRKEAMPLTCPNPKCRSPYWNHDRIRTIKEQEK